MNLEALKLKAGDNVRVRGRAGEVIGQIEHNVTPAELPALGGVFDESYMSMVRALFAEFGIIRLMLISHLHASRPVIFAAVTYDGAAWYDLKRQAITIELSSIQRQEQPEGD
jgi:hypothetical protein